MTITVVVVEFVVLLFWLEEVVLGDENPFAFWISEPVGEFPTDQNSVGALIFVPDGFSQVPLVSLAKILSHKKSMLKMQIRRIRDMF